MFRILPMRILLLIIVALSVTDVGVIATSGHASTPSAPHIVAASDYSIAEPSISDELRDIKQRASRSHPRTALPQAHPQVVHVTPPKPKVVVESTGSSYAWAHTAFAIRVANCESGGGSNDHSARYDGNAHLRDPNGHYGKWQFAPSTADSVGAPGAGIAALSEGQQDYFAWKLWKRDGWSPWECAGLV